MKRIGSSNADAEGLPTSGATAKAIRGSGNHQVALIIRRQPCCPIVLMIQGVFAFYGPRALKRHMDKIQVATEKSSKVAVAAALLPPLSPGAPVRAAHPSWRNIQAAGSAWPSAQTLP